MRKQPVPKQQTRYGSAQRNNLMGMAVNRGVFVPAALVILALACFGALLPKQLESGADLIQRTLADNFGWFYILAMNIFLVFALFLVFSRFGRIRLGGPDARPEFSDWGWYSMLFAAGTGVGLLFYGLAEPISYFAAPPFGEPRSPEAAREALVQSYFHWGLHGWAMYGLVGLALCFFAYNRGLPLTVRSAFQPLLGKRVEGPIGHAIDVLAVTGTLLGVAVSLGLGTQQLNTGLNETFNVPSSMVVQLILIAVITTAASISVVTGLSGGIQKLSKLAILIGAVMIVYVTVVGPTRFLFDAMIESLGSYIQQIPSRGTYLEAFKAPDAGGWQNRWTLFYFAWWISWSPFVGMFIARISRGRTLRQYLIGVLLVPTGVSILWLTALGGSALYQALYDSSLVVEVVNADVALGSFVFLEFLDVPRWMALTSMTLLVGAVAIFFITSSDSGSLVIDIISSGGDPDPPTAGRIFWAVAEGGVAAVLLVAGGLKALQSVAVIAGLPFVILVLLMCLGLYLGLRDSVREAAS
jgi:choline/glycine/proline betaine transport protein